MWSQRLSGPESFLREPYANAHFQIYSGFHPRLTALFLYILALLLPVSRPRIIVEDRDQPVNFFNIIHCFFASAEICKGNRTIRQHIDARMIIAETSGTPHYEPTRKFYTSMGYKIEASIKDFFTGGDDLAIFVKRLYKVLK